MQNLRLMELSFLELVIQIDDIISGVTLDLATVESGTTVNLTISRDTDSIKTSVNDFLTAYNEILEFINQEFTYDEDTETSGVVGGRGVHYLSLRVLFNQLLRVQ